MELRYIQTGGLAGLRMTADLDTANLPADEAAHLEQLAAAARAEPAPSGGPSTMRDYQQYEVAVTDQGETTVLRGTDVDAGPALRALIEQLRPRAEPTR
jgi:Emfourin